VTDWRTLKAESFKVINSDIKRFRDGLRSTAVPFGRAAARMAVPAWHAVRETADTLKNEGVEVFIKRSLASGFARYRHPLFCRDNTTMLPATPVREERLSETALIVDLT